ncbi:MAG: 4Fe-4S binding protein [Methanomicrobiales archaeon]|nr:4Fe-4S binding protein [Methanomicrobiales archaeon]
MLIPQELAPSSLRHVITHRPVINFHLCGKCGTCANFCRKQAINHQHNGNYEVFLDNCIGCGVCATVCPNGAIEMAEVGGIASFA